jgi:hypothetical protein
MQQRHGDNVWPRLIGLALMLVVTLGSVAPRAQVIDRILAVVDTTIITLSDAMGALRLGLIQGVQGADPLPAAVDRLIERQLMLAEVDRYAQPPPADAEVEKKVAEIRARFPASGQFDQVLFQSALSLDQLRRLVRDDLRIASYLDERFGSRVQQPSEEELLQYYQSHPAAFSRGGAPRPFAEVHDEVRATLLAARRAAQVQEWMNGLRRRVSVTVLVSTPKGVGN